MNQQIGVRHDRRITIVLILSGIVVVLIALGTPAVISTSNTTDEVRRNGDITGCRSELNAGVTEARTEFDVARSERDTATTELNLLTNAGLQAAVTDDDDGLAEIASQLTAARAEVTAAEAVVVAATAHLREVSADFADAISLSRDDPAAFLEMCEETT